MKIDVTGAGVDYTQAKHQRTENLGMTFKAQLRLYLDSRGMTAAELARKASVSKQVISLWLGGAKPKNVEQVKACADALGVTVDHLLFGEGISSNSKETPSIDALFGDQWLSGVFEVKIRRVKGGEK